MKVILTLALILCYVSNAERVLNRYEIVQPVLNIDDDLLKIIVESKIYDFEITLHMEKDKSGFYSSSQESSDQNAFGSIINSRFVGQFSLSEDTFILEDPAKIGAQGNALLYRLDDLPSPPEGFERVKRKSLVASGPQLSTRVADPGPGNICTIRIFVDKYLLALFNNDKNHLKTNIKNHEFQLNNIYKFNKIKVNGQQLEFRITDVIFHDQEYCSKNKNSGKSCYNKTYMNFMMIVSCKKWKSNEDELLIETFGLTDYSDRCLNFLFTNHNFGSTLGTLDPAFIVC